MHNGQDVLHPVLKFRVEVLKLGIEVAPRNTGLNLQQCAPKGLRESDDQVG
ncbi:hypothetical protein LJR219_005055 [Phenylobacterium sp. LjRoot219]|uniref:hypothetical protein n=1 Tax=Phenylobacterium sp. LjRoot219 TaxID=3342283 RepID=UPI003ECDCBD6